MRVGEVRDQGEVSWGQFRLRFLKLSDGSWRVEGSLELDIFWDLEGLPVEVEPLFPEIPYFVDLVPDIFIPAGYTRRLEIPIPVDLRVSVGGMALGEFRPARKRAYLGEVTGGSFALYVIPQEVEPPMAHLWVDAVNETGERLLLDEITVNPETLSLFEKEGSWVTDLVKVFPKADSLRVQPTGFGEGRKLVEGKPEPEVFTRFKKLAGRIRGVVA